MRVSHVTERLDEIGKPAWIALLVLSFILFWPLGLALLFFMHWSGRMGFGRHGYGEFREWRGEFKGWRHRMHEARGRWHYAPTSGNRAFDEYREEALRKLEEEQQEFREFLDRLRHAKDKAEFDQFMDERAHRPASPETPPEA